MMPPARVARTVVVGLLLRVVVSLIVVPLLVRDMDVATLLLIGVSAVLFASSIVMVLVRRMDAEQLHNASVTYHLQPPVVNVVLAVVYSVIVTGAIALGIGFLSIGNVIGWGLVLCGAAGLVLLVFEIWVARRPVDDFAQEFGPEHERSSE